MTATPGKKLISPRGRVSFESVFKPSGMEGGAKTYNVTLLIPKEMDETQQAAFDAMVDNVNAACFAKFGCDIEGKDKNGKIIKRNLKSPIRCGSEKPDLDGYGDDVWFVRFVSYSQVGPGVIDSQKNTITRESGLFYNGCWARVSYDAFTFDQSGNKGVSLGLGNVQKLADDEAFGTARTTADEDFDIVEIDDLGTLEDVLS